LEHLAYSRRDCKNRSEKHLNDLLNQATEIVRRRLYAAAEANGADGEVGGALAEVAGEGRNRIAAAYGDAQRTLLAMMHAGKLDESELAAFAGTGNSHGLRRFVARCPTLQLSICHRCL
jgi:hypothetical protein